MKHALLSPSAASRWINCPPSARLNEKVPEAGSNVARDEGTDAHTLAEHKLRKALGERVRDPRKRLTYYDQNMEECTDQYVDFCMEELGRLGSEAMILVEQRVSYADYVPQGSGIADCMIVGNGELVAIDFKYGKGVLVKVEENPQLKLYALGCLLAFDGIYDIEKVTICVVQPRLEILATATVKKEALYQWAEEVVKPAADLAWVGKGELNAGEHCTFCKVKERCRAWKKMQEEVTGQATTEPPLLTDKEIAEIYSKADEIIGWLKDVKEYALLSALNGTKYPGYKVVEGTSKRRYTDREAIVDRLLKTGYRDIYQPPELLGLTDMTNLLGKKRFGELLEGAVKDADGKPTYPPLVEKPPGKPTLVPESDKRPELNAKTAADVFDAVQDDEMEDFYG